MAQQGEATADGTAIVAAAAVAQQLQASSDQQEQSRSLQESHEVLRIQKTYFIFQHDSCCLHCHGLARCAHCRPCVIRGSGHGLAQLIRKKSSMLKRGLITNA